MLKNYKKNKGFNHLCEVAGNEGFKRKGNVFFRIVGDGALQVMQYHWTKRPFYQEIVKIGLFSMYGELEPQWLTRLGCIPRYNYRYLQKPRWEIEERSISDYMADNWRFIYGIYIPIP